MTIERIFFDENKNSLLNLYRLNAVQSIRVRSESYQTLAPQGSFEDVPGLGRRVFVGERRPKPGQISITLATGGRNHTDAMLLQREILNLVPRIAYYSRVPGGTMDIAGFSGTNREFKGGGMTDGNVTVTLECSSPYFWQEERTVAVPAGPPVQVQVGGVARSGVRLAITATGGSGIVNPSIVSDAGRTRWLGTVSPGQTLVIDNLNGGHQVTLDGFPVHLKLTGPFPFLDPGVRTVTVDAPTGIASLTWKEGVL